MAFFFIQFLSIFYAGPCERLNDMMEFIFIENVLINIVVFTMGMAVGSFLNVCIARLPKLISIVWPGSMCPKCRTPLKWRDNIPLVSYLALKGRCRSCGGTISVRYAVVEILGGLSALSVFVFFGPSVSAFIYFALISSLVVVTFIDADHGIIPDAITIPGLFVGLAASFFLPGLSFFDSVLGAAAGWAVLYAVAWSYKKMTGVDGMGGGDIKLLAMIGSFTGWGGALFALFAASIIGTLAGLLVMGEAVFKGDGAKGDAGKTGDGKVDDGKGDSGKTDDGKAGEGKGDESSGGAVNRDEKSRMKLAIPFGPFLSIGAMVYLFFGSAVVEWYLGF